MKLKSFGCSFIWGSDLPDDGRNLPRATASRLTWPALLAQDLGYEYECYARPGAGNLQITERLLNQICKDEHSLFVIGWTWIDRFDYNQDKTHHWKTIMPIDTDHRATVYYRDLHSQYRDKLTTLINIKLAIDTLKQKNCPFIMTYMDELIFETEWHATPSILFLQDYVRPYMTKFNGLTFLDWSKKNNFEISPTLHPLEPAHQAGFELIKSYNLTQAK
jgi:hypothetical protein